MSSKKRKGDVPETTAAPSAQKVLRNVRQSSQLKAGIDKGDGGDEDHAPTRIQRDEARAELAAARLKIEHLEATASEPCARCNFYSDWAVRVRTMSGHVHTIACPDGPKTLVAHVKQRLAHFDPKCHILQQVTLVLPCEASSSSSSANASDPALADDRTLASYGLSKRDVVELLLVDMNWSSKCREMIEIVKAREKRSILNVLCRCLMTIWRLLFRGRW